MIKVENVEVTGFQAAIRGMRNPMQSNSKSDSRIVTNYADNTQEYVIGPNDLELAKKLVRAGVEHRTFCRMLTVSMDITAPLYWWKEADRYTVGKSQVSTSTMHTIHKKEFELDDFSHEQLSNHRIATLRALLMDLNNSRDCFLKTKDKQDWWDMIQLLPTSYNQKRTVMMSYEVCLKIIRERRGHRLDEWYTFILELLRLPYMSEFWEACNGNNVRTETV